jgi:hypothetical protein
MYIQDNVYTKYKNRGIVSIVKSTVGTPKKGGGHRKK